MSANGRTVAVVDLVTAIRHRRAGMNAADVASAAGDSRLIVHGAYTGSGASTVSVALAEELAERDVTGATVIDLAEVDAFGVNAAMETRADIGLYGWTGGRRGAVRIVQVGGDPENADRIPGRAIVDAGFHDWWSPVDVVAVRATVPGVLRAESALVSRPARAIAVVAASKWPSAARACLGPTLRAMDAEGRVVFFPNESQLAVNGLSTDPLPMSTRRAAARLLDILEFGNAGFGNAGFGNAGSRKDGASA